MRINGLLTLLVIAVVVILVALGVFLTRQVQLQTEQTLAATGLAAQSTAAAQQLSARGPDETPLPHTPPQGPTLPPSWTPPPTYTASATRTHTFTPTATLTASHTATYTPTDTRTFTPTFTPTNTATFTATYTPSRTPTFTSTPTYTVTPSITPLPTDTPRPTITPTQRPGAVEPVLNNNYDILNILLIGSDIREGSIDYRTDTMIIVSVNRTTGTVNMLSLPRDLWVFIPRYGNERINTAALWGDLYRYPGGGVVSLIETIRYNLGIHIDRYAEVNFDGFQQIVDKLGGIDVPVDCPVTDYRLQDGTNPNVLANYKLYTLPIGYHHMDGSLALWFARSRSRSSDFDRNRRQQLVLRAIWSKIKENGMANQIAALWEDVTKIVKTDLTIGDVLSLLPIALEIDGTKLHSFFLGPSQVSDWQTPQGAWVLLPRKEAVRKVMEDFMTPPTVYTLSRESPLLWVFNGTPNEGLSLIAASRLAWEGFAPQEMGNAERDDYASTQIYDYTGGAKPQSLKLLLRALNANAKQVINKPDPNAEVDFKVILGANYSACTYTPYGGGLND